MSPWHSLETVRGQAAVGAVWRSRLGDCFQSFSSAFLQRLPEPARRFPCPHDCGCAHEVIRHEDSSIVGICRCAPWSCDDLKLTAEDIALWELSWPRLGRALCKALGLDLKSAGFGLSHTSQIGSWSADAVPVILTIQSEACGFRAAVAELVARLRRRFILLAPTSAHLDAVCVELLTHAGAGFFDLAGNVLVRERGSLQPAKTPGELFAEFTPEPKPVEEDVARRAFALVEQLDSERPIRPPTVLTVFRLYCIEELNPEQVARKCRCSRGTVLNRLKLIRERTGVDPDHLRRVSAHLGRIEDDIGDSRAAHLHRRRLIYDDLDVDDGGR